MEFSQRSFSDLLPSFFCEDNQAAVRMLETGKNPTLRYMGRTQNVDMAMLFEFFRGRLDNLRYCSTDQQAADIFTKHCTNPEKWDLVCRLIGHLQIKRHWLKDAGLDLEAAKEEKKSSTAVEDTSTAPRDKA